MQNKLMLLPMPREMQVEALRRGLQDMAVIAISEGGLLFEGQTAQRYLSQFGGVQWGIVAAAGRDDAGLVLTVDEEIKWAQGYQLIVDGGQILIRGADAAGVFYGVCTLGQLLRQYGRGLPNMAIVDSPDFPVRGVMLDVSRDKVPTMETLYGLIDRLASWKINQVQLYMEHTFAYREHEQVWGNASPFTGQELLELDVFCRERHIDLVPNQNSLGHMERWLKYEEYKHLAECPDGFIGDFGDHLGERRPAMSLNVVDEASIEFVAGLYDALLPHFTSELVNVGGDEPWELGKCRSKAAVEGRGQGRVYIDYLRKLHEIVLLHGRRMMFWADVIVKYPELIRDLPSDVIALEWGYYTGHPYADHSPMFAESGLSFYVCPGTSSWNTLSGRTENSLGNIRDAVENGLQYGASGLLVTDWGDRGHWQPLPISYLGFVYAAGVGWAYDSNVNMDVPTILDRFAFEDEAGVMGRLVYDLGNLYQLPDIAYPNGHLLFFLLQLNQADLAAFVRNLDENVVTDGRFGLNRETLWECLNRLDAIMRSIDKARMKREDAGLIRDEFEQVTALLGHACKRGLMLLGEERIRPAYLLTELEGLIPQQRLNWLARNRPGGLKESIARFEPVLREYREMAGEMPSYL